MAVEALQMLKHVNERCTQAQVAALEASLDWCPMILGDGQKVGSLVQKCCCEQCNSMPMTDGQWFLFKRANSNQTGPLPQDLLTVKAVAPNHKDLATIQMFEMWTNLGKKACLHQW
eukprot:12431282-Karenia_brevis.AAC.1